MILDRGFVAGQRTLFANSNSLRQLSFSHLLGGGQDQALPCESFSQVILKALSPRPPAPLSSFTIARFKSSLTGLPLGELPANEEV